MVVYLEYLINIVVVVMMLLVVDVVVIVFSLCGENPETNNLSIRDSPFITRITLHDGLHVFKLCRCCIMLLTISSAFMSFNVATEYRCFK